MGEGEGMKGIVYRLIMRIAHRYNWHYAPPIYPDGDTQLWCMWCGFRQTVRRIDEVNRKAARVMREGDNPPTAKSAR